MDIFSLSIIIEKTKTNKGYVQKINIAKLTSIYLTDNNNHEVKNTDPTVINKKSKRLFL